MSVQAQGAPPPGASVLASGKGHTDENFPVASFILEPQHRGPVMAYYRFARTADDVSDNPAAPPHEKLAHLAIMRATLAGERDDNPEALPLRQVQQSVASLPSMGSTCWRRSDAT